MTLDCLACQNPLHFIEWRVWHLKCEKCNHEWDIDHSDNGQFAEFWLVEPEKKDA